MAGWTFIEAEPVFIGCIQLYTDVYNYAENEINKRLTDGENLVSEKSEKLRFF